MSDHLKATVDVRKGQAGEKLSRGEFGQRFRKHYADPAYGPEREAIGRLEEIAWKAYDEGRKAPVTAPAGVGYADPTYDLSVEWSDTARRLREAGQLQRDRATPSRVLLICGSARNDGSCPGEISKSWRLLQIARQALAARSLEADVLDLSRVTSEYGRAIHPCKGCVSTAMPLCHWPCSCYPNHGLGQGIDWMAEIYERWVAAHGVLIVAPTYWYQSPSPLKLMIDRLVCADGGNPDPSTTHGKKAEEAKAIEAAGWDYPKHLAGRAYGVVVHGDVAGIESQRRALCDWLDWMGLIDAGPSARLDRYIDYYGPYFTSHRALDADAALQREIENATVALAHAVDALRSGKLHSPDEGLAKPRAK